MEGTVKAAAIAMISLRKKMPYDLSGKDLFYVNPNFCVSALSFIILVVVFTVNVVISFTIEGSTPFICQ